MISHEHPPQRALGKNVWVSGIRVDSVHAGLQLIVRVESTGMSVLTWAEESVWCVQVKAVPLLKSGNAVSLTKLA